MNDFQQQDDQPFEIRIDKDGVWYYNGAEMFRKEILALFFENLFRDESGRYYIQIGMEMCYLTVEDTPIVVKSVHEMADSEREKEETAIGIFLSDSSLEKIDLDSLRIGEGNVLYCDLQRGFPARFTRAAYYQIADRIEFDEKRGYFIPANGKQYFIKEELGGK